MNYNTKAKDSFTAKLVLFVFNQVINQKESFTIEEFKTFEMTEKLIETYTIEYWQADKDHVIKGITVDKIYHQMLHYIAFNKEQVEVAKAYYINNVFPALMPMDSFKLLENTTKCYYCEITKEQIVELGNKGKLRKKNLRGWSLEIDRKNPNLEYFADNCVMACYWCNNAKTDEFTAEEFKEIAKGIKKVWSNRLSK
jgi:5-methylcytosine-specific restriction endonuclease McrA